ncbi:Xaa-Pro peptidase family protein [Thermosulfurimonas sp.]|uniref:M24 family metallopeptidase n=1 Tax=Thermosulfurimonas sp. TaxID=2080236 RepID=UPI0025F61EC3|nr:Xaa-Pro peptidase family protein [Thermosulfurimonas sp.]
MLPRAEIQTRLESLRRVLSRKGLDAALITSPLHLFYFTGAFALGHLLVTAREIRFLVFRPLERVRQESPLPAESLRSLKALPAVLDNAGVRRIGMELSTLSQERFRRYQAILADYQLEDLSPDLLKLRMYKSSYEVDCLRRAGELLAEALREALPEWREGMSELEALGRVELALRRRGHPGLVRSSRGNEFATGLLVSGKEGLTPSYMVAGEGGCGVLGFPSGASPKPLRRGEPVLLDVAGFYAGYYVDQTRMLSVGEPSSEVKDLFSLALRLMKAGEGALRSGVPAEEVYFRVAEEAEHLGVSRYFMAHGQEGVGFVGHGVGLCVDEDPPLAPGIRTTLRSGMVLALEPKLHVSGTGVIGLEDTFYLSEDGPQRLTVFPRDLYLLP